RIFRSRAVTGANAVMLLLVAGFFGTFFIGSLYLERVLRFDALAIGLGFLPVSLSIGLMSFAFAEPLITRFGHRVVLRGSLGMVLVALLWLARLPASATYFVDVAPSLALIGIGAGLGFPAIVGLAMSGGTSRPQTWRRGPSRAEELDHQERFIRKGLSPAAAPSAIQAPPPERAGQTNPRELPRVVSTAESRHEVG